MNESVRLFAHVLVDRLAGLCCARVLGSVFVVERVLGSRTGLVRRLVVVGC